MKKLLFLSIIAICGMITANGQDSTLAEYAGKYKFAQGSAVGEAEIVFSDSALSVTSAMGSASLTRSEGDVFTMVEFNGTVTFFRNADKKIVGIKVSVMGMELEGKKEAIVPKPEKTLPQPPPAIQ